ncbi:MAG: excinuclease ABC subunit UvrC [Candidatus Omnitrophota bacterium]|jgi:excinuclease ABC subunit C
MDLKEKVSGLPAQPGVYIFKDDAGKVLYVGKASSLRNRVRSYFQRSKDHVPRIEALVAKVRDIDFVTTATEAEALLYESNLIKEHQPKYNVELRDSKTYPLIKITMAEDFPRVMVARGKRSDGSIYFGPYTDATLLHEAVKAIRRIFMFRTCVSLPKKACVYDDLGLCSAPCEGKISKEGYSDRIKEVILFIEGKKGELIRRLSGKMKEYSAQKRFEEAAGVRDQIEALSTAVSRRTPAASGGAGMAELAEVLSLKAIPRHIEAFDISNIKGEDACGSMVAFRDGRPDKSNYRMFRIKEIKGQDDYAMMREIVRRRYSGVLKRGDALPDLILIDGGRGHLSSAAIETKALGLGKIPMIGLAKVFEHIYTLDKALPIALPPSSKALQLIQRVRDESHRFAIRYHHILRRKALVGETKREKSTSCKKGRPV